MNRKHSKQKQNDQKEYEKYQLQKSSKTIMFPAKMSMAPNIKDY